MHFLFKIEWKTETVSIFQGVCPKACHFASFPSFPCGFYCPPSVHVDSIAHSSQDLRFDRKSCSVQKPHSKCLLLTLHQTATFQFIIFHTESFQLKIT